MLNRSKDSKRSQVAEAELQRSHPAGLGLAGLVLADILVLTRLRPDFSALLSDLRAPHAWVQSVGTDQASTTLAAAALWIAACWLAIGLGFSVAAMLPGQLGQAAATIAEAVAPATLRRVVSAAAGVSVVLSPVTAWAESGPSNPAPPPSQGSIVLVLPTDGAHLTPSTTAGPTPTQTAKPTATTTVKPPPTTGPHSATAAQITVEPGDSLWSITASRLGPDATEAAIAHAWPILYQTNRTVLGPDPSLIRPGEILNIAPEVQR